MQVNVSQQLKAPIGSTRSYEINGVVDINGNDEIVRGNIRLMRTNRGILVKGILETESELTCSRCLSTFRLPIKLDFEEEYFPTTDIASGLPLPVPDEPDHFTIDEHNILDLTEAVRQYALLAIPMKPLCQQDCRGLCPSCGINLNLSSCQCPTKTTDPRWLKLKELIATESKLPSKEQEGKS